MLSRTHYDLNRSRRLSSSLGTVRSRVAAGYITKSQPDYQKANVPAGELAAETIKKILFIEDIGAFQPGPSVHDIVVEVDGKSIFQSRSGMHAGITANTPMLNSLIKAGISARRQAELDFVSGVTTAANKNFKQLLFVPELTGYESTRFTGLSIKEEHAGRIDVGGNPRQANVTAKLEAVNPSEKPVDVKALQESADAMRRPPAGDSPWLRHLLVGQYFGGFSDSVMFGLPVTDIENSLSCYSARRFVDRTEVDPKGSLTAMKDVAIYQVGAQIVMPHVFNVEGSIYSPSKTGATRIPQLAKVAPKGVILRVIFRFLWNDKKAIVLTLNNTTEDTDAALLAESNTNLLAEMNGYSLKMEEISENGVTLAQSSVAVLQGGRTMKSLFNSTAGTLSSYYAGTTPLPTLDYYENASLIGYAMDRTFDEYGAKDKIVAAKTSNEVPPVGNVDGSGLLNLLHRFNPQDQDNYYPSLKQDTNTYVRIYAHELQTAATPPRANFYTNSFADYGVYITQPVVYPL